MDLAYVEMIEDMASGFTSTAHVRSELDAVLNGPPPGGVVARVDRDAWLRGSDAASGQAAMLSLVDVARRGR